jgi:hypothetical protein
LTHQQENRLLETGALELSGTVLRLTNLDYFAKPAPLKNAAYDDAEFMEEQHEEGFLDKVQESQDEAREAFGQDAYLLQEAQERGLSMDDLWAELGEEWSAEYFGTPLKRKPKVGPEPDRLPKAEALPKTGKAHMACPKCKKANAHQVHVLSSGEPPLGECRSCGAFFLLC